MFRSGFFTSDSWTINGDGFAIGNKAEGSDFLAKIVHKCLGDGAAEVTTTGFQVVKKTGLTCTVKPFFVCKNGYIAWNTEDTDITFTSSASEQVFYVGLRLDVATGEFTGGVAGRTTFVSATDLVSAIVTIPANAVTLTDGMIADTRYNATYCGQIDEYRERSLALIAELEDALALLISGGVPAHASTHATGETDAIAPSDIGAAAATHKSNHATGGSDALAPSDIGAASLDGSGKVTPTQLSSSVGWSISESRDLALTDSGKMLFTGGSSAITFTVKTGIFQGGEELEICRYGSGAVTIAAGSGVSLLSMDGALTISGQYGVAALKFLSDAVCLVTGALA